MRAAIYRFADDVPVWVAYPIRALFLIGVLIFLAGCFIFACGAWFVEQVRG